MKVLGFDTATAATAVALLDSDTGVAVEERDDPPPGARPRHTARLLALVEAVLARAQLGWDGVDRLAVGVGPGTFTGIRIGVASARALARTRAIPLVGSSTLRALALAAAPAAADDGRAVLAVLDARRREVFVAGWEPAGGGLGPDDAPLRGARAVAPERLARELAEDGRRWLAVGDGAVRHRALIESGGARIPLDDDPLHRVGAVAHCRLAAATEPTPVADVLPDYLRVADAELARRRRGSGGVA